MEKRADSSQLSLVLVACLGLFVGRLEALSPEDLEVLLREPPAVEALVYEFSRAFEPRAFTDRRSAEQFAASTRTNAAAGTGERQYYILRYDGGVSGYVFQRCGDSADSWGFGNPPDNRMYGRRGEQHWTIQRADPGPYVLTLHAHDGTYPDTDGRTNRFFWSMERRATEILRLGLFEALVETFELTGKHEFAFLTEPDYGLRVRGELGVNASGEVEELRYEIPGRWQKRIVFDRQAGRACPWPRRVEVWIRWLGAHGKPEADWQPYVTFQIVECRLAPHGVARDAFDPDSYLPTGARWYEIDHLGRWVQIDGTNRVVISDQAEGDPKRAAPLPVVIMITLPTVVAGAVLCWRVLRQRMKGKEVNP